MDYSVRVPSDRAGCFVATCPSASDGRRCELESRERRAAPGVPALGVGGDFPAYALEREAGAEAAH